ncbi:hypothetical protein ABK040_012324, partial [Willaertia magna]
SKQSSSVTIGFKSDEQLLKEDISSTAQQHNPITITLIRPLGMMENVYHNFVKKRSQHVVQIAFLEENFITKQLLIQSLQQLQEKYQLLRTCIVKEEKEEEAKQTQQQQEEKDSFKKTSTTFHLAEFEKKYCQEHLLNNDINDNNQQQQNVLEFIENENGKEIWKKYFDRLVQHGDLSLLFNNNNFIIKNKEINSKYTLETNLLYKIIFIKDCEKGKSELIINYHQSLFDGISANVLISEILRKCKENFLNNEHNINTTTTTITVENDNRKEEEKVYPPFDELFTVQSDKKNSKFIHCNEQSITEDSDNEEDSDEEKEEIKKEEKCEIAAFPTFEYHKKQVLFDLLGFSNHYIFFKLNKELTDKLCNNCKLNGTTIHGAILAANLLIVCSTLFQDKLYKRFFDGYHSHHHYDMTSEKKSKVFPFSSSISLRNYCNVDSYALGNFINSIPHSVKVDSSHFGKDVKKEEFWNLAKQLKDEMTNYINEYNLFDKNNWSDFCNNEKLLNEISESRLNFSNLCNFGKLDNYYNDLLNGDDILQVKELYSVTSQIGYGSLLETKCIGLNDQLMFTLTFVDGFLNSHLVEHFADEMIEILQKAVE